MSNGALAGFPVVDIKATLYDGSYHDVDSSVLAFQVTTRAYQQGLRRGYETLARVLPGLLHFVNMPTAHTS